MCRRWRELTARPRRPLQQREPGPVMSAALALEAADHTAVALPERTCRRQKRKKPPPYLSFSSSTAPSRRRAQARSRPPGRLRRFAPPAGPPAGRTRRFLPQSREATRRYSSSLRGQLRAGVRPARAATDTARRPCAPPARRTPMPAPSRGSSRGRQAAQQHKVRKSDFASSQSRGSESSDSRRQAPRNKRPAVRGNNKAMTGRVEPAQ